jgi:uncharacterized protein (TIGR02145 family)
MIKKVLLFFLILNLNHVEANNLAITKLTRTSRDVSAGVNNAANNFKIAIDISWQNSWRTDNLNGDGITNWDAAWIFAKYRLNGIGEWKHIQFAENGHEIPTGIVLENGLLDPKSNYHSNANPLLGFFVYRENNGAGNLSINDLKLKWNYASQGILDTDSIDIKFFGIEMVFVPEGAFYVGSGGSEVGSFTNGSWISGATIPLLITSEAPLNIAQTTGSLWGTSNTGNSTIGGAGTLPAAYPKGFGSFYCMKYEISQQQYVNFLNSLTQTQANTRKHTGSSNRYSITGNTVGAYETTNPYVACNYLSWMDLAAYLDWAALRPMTELEFEKACRGTATPVANEYAWGNTVATAATGINNEGFANEVASNPTANAVFSSSTSGPMRIGNFAKAISNREQAGATYYGIMEMSGNLWERVVSVGNIDGRSFEGTHGNGILSNNGNANTISWSGLVSGEVSGALGSGSRGGNSGTSQITMPISTRELATNNSTLRTNSGGRGVRSTEISFSSASLIITTDSISEIASTKADIFVTVVDEGESAVTERGIVFGLSANPSLADSVIIDLGSGPGSYNINLECLDTNTTYFVRAFATNLQGTVYGNELSFTTLPLSNIQWGECFEGGLVFYILTSGDFGYVGGEIKGIVAAKEDIGKMQFGCRGSLTTTTNSIGYGKINTKELVDYHDQLAFDYYSNPSGCNALNDGTVAAKACDTLIYNGFDDWYLPTLLELEKLYQNLHNLGFGNYQDTVYWSSSETNPNSSRMINFDDGGTANLLKNLDAYVLPTRNFTTQKLPPVVNTTLVSNISDIDAISGGNVTESYAQPITARGVVWATNPNPTLADNFTSDGVGLGTFTSNMNSLIPNTTYYYRAYATNKFGTSYGDEFNFTTFCISPSLFNDTISYSTVTDIEGNEYKTIEIGNQEWMAENLRTTSFNNLDPILSKPIDLDWENSTDPLWAVYNNTLDNECPNGKLYNYLAFSDSRNICPTGWHVPTNAEWNTLKDYLIDNGYNWDMTFSGNKIAKSLASKALWEEAFASGYIGFDSSENNRSGFTALPVGARGFNGSYTQQFESTYFGSATEDSPTHFFGQQLNFQFEDFITLSLSKRAGVSCRCIKDFVATLPTITTEPITSITKTSAEGGGNVVDDGGDIVGARGIVYSTNPNPTLADDFTMNGAGTGSFTSSFGGLIPNTTYYVRAYATNNVGTAYGNQEIFTTNGPCDGATMINYNTHNYNLVEIGDQCWFAENLRTTNFSNGDPIANVTVNGTWASLTTPAWCDYANNATNGITYGKLYNWYAAIDSRNVCPTAWSVPSFSDLNILANYIGNFSNAGGAMKTTTGWNAPNNGATNTSGFSALPGGYRFYDGSFFNINVIGNWWLLDAVDVNNARSFNIWNEYIMLNTQDMIKKNGLSIRCVKY